MHEDLLGNFALDGRVALVTGAASGIGREIAVVMAEAGAIPVIADINRDGLDQTADMIGQQGAQTIKRRTDVSQRAEIEALARETLDALGRIDIWVNVAGVIVNRPIMDAVEEEAERLLSVNLKGVYWGCSAAGRAMKDRGKGSIINMSSSGADSVVPGLSLYAMSKAAVNMATRTAAKEFGPHGIRVNAIAPGWIDTPMGTHSFVDENGEIDPAKREIGLRQREQSSPLGITGVPRDIALAALYLASDASRFVTGQILRVNGGVAMP